MRDVIAYLPAAIHTWPLRTRALRCSGTPPFRGRADMQFAPIGFDTSRRGLLTLGQWPRYSVRVFDEEFGNRTKRPALQCHDADGVATRHQGRARCRVTVEKTGRGP